MKQPVKLASMAIMILFEIATLVLFALLAFREGRGAAAALSLLSMASMLAMGTLASSSVKGRFRSRIAMNWTDQGMNTLAQSLFLAAALLSGGSR